MGFVVVISLRGVGDSCDERAFEEEGVVNCELEGDGAFAEEHGAFE